MYSIIKLHYGIPAVDLFLNGDPEDQYRQSNLIGAAGTIENIPITTYDGLINAINNLKPDSNELR